MLAWVQALEAVARLRCSAGLDVASYMGACYRRTSTDIDLPAVHCDQVRGSPFNLHPMPLQMHALSLWVMSARGPFWLAGEPLLLDPVKSRCLKPFQPG